MEHKYKTNIYIYIINIDIGNKTTVINLKNKKEVYKKIAQMDIRGYIMVSILTFRNLKDP